VGFNSYPLCSTLTSAGDNLYKMMGEVAGEHCQHNLEACRLRAGLNNYDFFCVCLIPAVYNLLIPQT